MLSIITPGEAAARSPKDQDYIVEFYWRSCPILERIAQGITENSCGTLRSLRFTWNRPKKAATSETVLLGHTLPAMLAGARQLAGASFTSLHIEKVPAMNDLFALAQFANGVVAELEINECLPNSMPDICFVKANFTNGHITNQPLVGHFNEEGAIMATDDAMQTVICENNNLAAVTSLIEQMKMRFLNLAVQGKAAAGNQGATELMNLIGQAMGGK